MRNFKKLIFIIAIAIWPVLAAAFLAAPAGAAALDIAQVNYPIAELGGCQNQAACAVFCDQPANMLTCVSYAEKNYLIDPAEAALAKKAISKIQSGQTPGGCKDRATCQAYCQGSVKELNACIVFAEEIGVPVAEIEQAKKVAAALNQGASLPGNCRGKEACENYCQNADHIDECLIFAEAAQILPADELAEAKKVAPFLKNGQTPGGCKGKAECKAYCDQDNNFSECLGFAEKAGFVTAAEAELARKTGGKGPGGCKSQASCEAYCNLPANAKACGEFAVAQGLVDEKTAERIRSGYLEMSAGLTKMPPEMRSEAESCLNNLFGGNLSAVLSGEQAITQTQGGKIGACFEVAAQKYAQEQMKAGAGAAAGAPGSADAPVMPDVNSLNNVPSGVKEQIQQEMERQRQEAIQKSMPANLPTGAPPLNLPTTDLPPTGAPINLPIPPAVEIPPVPPADISTGPVPAPGGTQGPPCSTPEECQAMFGGSAPR